MHPEEKDYPAGAVAAREPTLHEQHIHHLHQAAMHHEQAAHHHAAAAQTHRELARHYEAEHDTRQMKRNAAAAQIETLQKYTERS